VLQAPATTFFYFQQSVPHLHGYLAGPSGEARHPRLPSRPVHPRTAWRSLGDSERQRTPLGRDPVFSAGQPKSMIPSTRSQPPLAAIVRTTAVKPRRRPCPGRAHIPCLFESPPRQASSRPFSRERDHPPARRAIVERGGRWPAEAKPGPAHAIGRCACHHRPPDCRPRPLPEQDDLLTVFHQPQGHGVSTPKGLPLELGSKALLSPTLVPPTANCRRWRCRPPTALVSANVAGVVEGGPKTEGN